MRLRFRAYAVWKSALQPGDPAREYWFYRFQTERLKILDEGEFGDAMWIEAEVNRELLSHAR